MDVRMYALGRALLSSGERIGSVCPTARERNASGQRHPGRARKKLQKAKGRDHCCTQENGGGDTNGACASRVKDVEARTVHRNSNMGMDSTIGSSISTKIAAMTPDVLALTLIAALSASRRIGRVDALVGERTRAWPGPPVSMTAITSFASTASPTATHSSPSSPMIPSASGIVSEMNGASSVLAPGVGAVAKARG